ncbi:STAS-like domain-containing protein, partial [Patescibacteria group bacterium]|nr:STAS-like domain-containing protein [Patescibacteria group bacterium]
MTIYLKKFGTLLSGRMLGKEAFSAFLPSLKDVKDSEKIEVDFEGVDVFSPSWGDEFLISLLEKFGDRVVLKNTKNPSVKSTLEFLERINKIKFN